MGDSGRYMVAVRKKKIKNYYLNYFLAVLTLTCMTLAGLAGIWLQLESQNTVCKLNPPLHKSTNQKNTGKLKIGKRLDLFIQQGKAKRLYVATTCLPCELDLDDVMSSTCQMTENLQQRNESESAGLKKSSLQLRHVRTSMAEKT